MNNYIYIGKIINTFGIKGELKIQSEFEYKDRVFKNGFEIYIGEEKIKEVINTYRVHKNYDMLLFNNYTNINEVLKYKGQQAYVNKEDIELADNNYLNEDLIGLEAIVDNKVIGIVHNIEKNAQELIVIKNNDKEYLIPNNDNFIKEINIKDKKIYINNIKGLLE